MAVELALENVVIEEIDISLLHPHPRNIEIYGMEDISELTRDIKEHGCKERIIVNQDNQIVSGHRRTRVLESLGYKRVTVERRTYANETEERKALLLANAFRDKTNMQMAREQEEWLAIRKKEAEEKQKAQGDKGALGKEYGSEGGRGHKKEEATNPLGQNFAQGGLDPKSNLQKKAQEAEAWKTTNNKAKNQRAPKSIDKAAKDVGFGSGESGRKAAKALNAVKKLEQEGKVEEAKVLETIANKSLDAASKVADMSKEENIAVLTKLATGEAKDVKEAKKIVKKEEIKKLQDADVNTNGTKVKERVVQPGQWWKLGQHLLYCGDSSSDDFKSKAQDAQAIFAFADPPYNAGVDIWDSGFEWKHDYLTTIAPIVAVTPGISAIKDFMRTTEMSYKWSMGYWIDNGMTRGAVGFGNWIYVALFANGSVHRGKQDFDKVSISNNERSELEHKGQKPLSMLLHIIKTFTNENDTVIDPFLGTGTTLIVCEQTKRICIGAELNPEYCTAIIKRWEAISGQIAEEITNDTDSLSC